MRNLAVRLVLPLVAPSDRLQRLWEGPSIRVPVGSWLRSHLLPGVIVLVGWRHTGSWQVASPRLTTGVQALRMARYVPPYLVMGLLLRWMTSCLFLGRRPVGCCVRRAIVG